MMTTRAKSMRPTTDTTRRTIFDIIAPRVSDARVLDLFAGAGTLGIEALSRGAASALFIERERSACDAIRRNLEATDLADRGTVWCREAAAVLRSGPDVPFDLVFLDPPYGRGLRFVTRILDALLAGPWVGPGGTVVVEAEAGILRLPVGLSEIRARRFGQTQVVVAERDEDQGNSHLSGDI